MKVLVVLPTYDEAANIEEVLRRLHAAVPDAHVLVVDDSSPDGTGDLAEEVAEELGGEDGLRLVEVMRRPSKSGLGSAYREGFRYGLINGFDVMVEMDSDLSHDPAALPSLLRAVDDGADLAIGSRYIPGGSIPDWSWHRRALSRWGNRYAGFVLGNDIADSTSGFRAYRSSALAVVDFHAVRADGYGFQIEMAYRVITTGGIIEEVPIAFVDRICGTSFRRSDLRHVEDVGLDCGRGVGARDLVGNTRSCAKGFSVSADKGIMEREVSTLIPPLRLGNLLREAREAAGLELDDLIAHSVLTVVDLDDLEHGRRLINDQLLGELMNLYGIDDATLAPERSRLIIDLDEGLISVAHSDISIGEATGADAILSRYLALVYRMRELPIGSPIGLRDIDLGVLSTALELDASDIEVRLERLIADEDGIERVQAAPSQAAGACGRHRDRRDERWCVNPHRRERNYA